MRLGVIVLTLLLLVSMPTIQAANAIHLSWVGNGFDVLFESPKDAPVVHWSGGGRSGDVASVAQPRPAGDKDGVWAAHIPAEARSYSVEGESFTIRAPPAPGEPIRVLFVADMGRSEDSWAVLDAMIREKPDLVLLGGDISYANGQQDLWDEWFGHMQPLISGVPVMTARGNHETICQDSQNNLNVCDREPAEYVEHFTAPGSKAYYSFDWGPAHFTALDTEAYHSDPAMGAFVTDADAQKSFLRGSLAARPASWNVVFFHRPLYSSNTHDEGADRDAHDDLVPVLDAGGADLVLYGHAHAYERSWPMKSDRIVARANAIHEGDGIYYVDSGGGGRSLYDEFGPQPDWSASRAVAFEYLVLDITKDRLDVTAKQPSGAVLDHVAITRAGSALPTITESAQPARSPSVALPVFLVALLALVAARGRRGSRR